MKKHLLINSYNRGGIKQKHNAFTLIELLAIIVILAIIAVITVPIILNIIENSRKGAATDSAYGYKDSVNKYYISELQNHNKLKLDGKYTVNSNGSLTPAEDNTFGFGDENVTSFPVQVSGSIPSSGELTYENNVLKSGYLVIGDYRVTFNSDGTVTTTKNNSSSSNEQSSGSGNPTPSNPYLTTFDGNYGYTSSVEVYSNSSDFVWGNFNDAWEVYFRNDGIKTELCGVFGVGNAGTVCLEPSTSGYSADFADCSGFLNYNGSGDTCIKGYAKAKADEMLAKGATSCSVESNGDAISCDMTSGGFCRIYASGIVDCNDSEAIRSYIYSDGTPSCDF